VVKCSTKTPTLFARQIEQKLKKIAILVSFCGKCLLESMHHAGDEC